MNQVNFDSELKNSNALYNMNNSSLNRLVILLLVEYTIYGKMIVKVMYFVYELVKVMYFVYELITYYTVDKSKDVKNVLQFS